MVFTGPFYDQADSASTNIAGVGTIATALCPTTTPNRPTRYQVIVGDLHLFFACVVFVMLAVMALLIYPGSRVYGYSLIILETILMTAFGISWVVKGGKLLTRPAAAYDGRRAPAIPAG